MRLILFSMKNNVVEPGNVHGVCFECFLHGARGCCNAK